MPAKTDAMIAKNDGTLPFVIAKSYGAFDSKNCHHAFKTCRHT
jgi:hypothetical protein